jgi:hypothetical protein
MTKKLLLAALVVAAASLAGCSRCRQMTCGWFNKGDRCGAPPPCAPPPCAPGMPSGAMMLPTTPQVLPGPIEVAPTL